MIDPELADIFIKLAESVHRQADALARTAELLDLAVAKLGPGATQRAAARHLHAVRK